MTEHQIHCPSPEALLEALTEGLPEQLDHVASCPRCGQDSALQTVLSTWRQLDTLPEIEVSANFEARLQARIARNENKQRRWLLLDGLFDWLHVPALAALITLLVWLPGPDRTAHQVDHQPLTRPSGGQGRLLESLRERPVGAEALQQLQRLYRQGRPASPSSRPENHS